MPSLAELAKRVEALEADNERLRNLGLGQPPDNAPPLPRYDTPTKTVYDVRSKLTGALVCPALDDPATARRERDRLNGEAAKVAGVNSRGDTVYVGGQQGEPTVYEVVEREVEDADERRRRDLKSLDEQEAQAKKDGRLDEPARPALFEDETPPTVRELIERQRDAVKAEVERERAERGDA